MWTNHSFIFRQRQISSHSHRSIQPLRLDLHSRRQTVFYDPRNPHQMEATCRKSIQLDTDQGREYTGNITDFFMRHGIVHETTTPYSSASNGIAERLNRTLFDMVRPMIAKSRLPPQFWAEAIDTAARIRN